MKKQFIPLAVLTLAIIMTAFTSCKKQKPEDETPAQEGLYLGIVGFNSELYTMPLGLLNQSTKHNFSDFIDQLSMQNGTILYHAVNASLNSLTSAHVPENLINASIVTFTDGLDQGSYALSNAYNSGSEYLAAVHSRIMNEQVGNTHISAYSIGVPGSDVVNMDDFRNNLNKLSSDPDNNVFEVNDMSEAADKFAEIAQQLYNQSTVYNVTLTIPVQEPNSVIRFTFDNVNNASESTHYIEGTYIRTNNNVGQLTNITYYGVNCMSGSTVSASSSGAKDVFTFQNLFDSNGNQVTTENVKLWNWNASNEYWGQNSEFDTSGGSQIVEEYKSAMIMLVLDCSSSLGSDFTNMKEAAKFFIGTLIGNYNGRK